MSLSSREEDSVPLPLPLPLRLLLPPLPLLLPSAPTVVAIGCVLERFLLLFHMRRPFGKSSLDDDDDDDDDDDGRVDLWVLVLP